MARTLVALGFVSAASALLSAQSAAPLPASALPMTLVGVALDSTEPARSLAFIRCPSLRAEDGAGGFSSGQTACKLAEVVEIREHAVAIRNLDSGRLELLRLGAGGASASTAPEPADVVPEPVVTKSAERVTVDLQKDLVSHYLANMDEVLSSALATPHRASAGAAIEGFELEQIKAGGAADRLGFQNGDVILDVNGVKLDSLDAVLRLMGQAPTAQQVQMSVLRNGQSMTFVFNTR